MAQTNRRYRLRVVGEVVKSAYAVSLMASLNVAVFAYGAMAKTFDHLVGLSRRSDGETSQIRKGE
jgi:hypothetical protein